MPFNWLIVKLLKKSDEDQKVWKETYNRANLKFPGGINDWFVFTLFFTIFLIPIVIVTTKFSIDIYTQNNKWIFFAGAGIIVLFCNYWIYHKNIAWLKKRIDEANKKFYLK